MGVLPIVQRKNSLSILSDVTKRRDGKSSSSRPNLCQKKKKKKKYNEDSQLSKKEINIECLVQLLTWLHVSVYRDFWNTERW